MKKEAVVAVLTKNDRILIIRRSDKVPSPGYWTPISGRLEPGEDQAKAVVREVQEEVGLSVRANRWVWECPTHDGVYTLHWWLVDLLDKGEVVVDPHEVSEARWMPVDEFLRLEPTFADDRYFFQHIFPNL